MAELSHYEDIVDVQVHFLTRMRMRLGNMNERPADDGSSDSVNSAVGKIVNDALSQRLTDERTMYDELIAEMQARRPQFYPGEFVLLLSYYTNDYGQEGIVLEVYGHNGAGGSQPTYEILTLGDTKLKTVNHQDVRPALLWGSSSPSSSSPYPFITPHIGALEPADQVTYADIIHEYGNRINMLREAVKAADQIHKHTDQDNDEQKENAGKTRETIISEVMESLHAVRSRMEEEHLRYVHGRFYRLV